MASDHRVDHLLYSVTDPETGLPALSSLLYRACQNDRARFEEATRVVSLYMTAAYEAGRRSVGGDD